MNKFTRLIALVAIGLILCSWGQTGHYIISSKSSLSFNLEMEQFQAWASYLAEHASDADKRKDEDPNEAPKHYIDIENYPEFINAGYIPQTLNEAITLHGSYNVYDWGILPYATKATFDSLKSNMARLNWDRAKFFAADLGHYVADGHMPMHITKNYNGQLTGNDGIHSRYESTMVNAREQQLSQYEGAEIHQIDNVTQYILNYLYANYKYVDSVLAADNYATGISSNYSSTAYKNALWEKTGEFTTMLFANASHALAELMYTAWKEAGSPSLTGVDMIGQDAEGYYLYPIRPNPARNEVSISFHLEKPCVANLIVCDGNGKIIATLAQGELGGGNQTITWLTRNQPNGIYLVALRANGRQFSQKLVVNH